MKIQIQKHVTDGYICNGKLDRLMRPNIDVNLKLVQQLDNYLHIFIFSTSQKASYFGLYAP